MPTPLGQRNTAQREAILEVIHDAEGPLTVQQILERAGSASRTLGIATVYRTVALLLEAGRIQTVSLPDGQTRYESADLGHHHHFNCTRCGRVFDLDVCPVHLPRDLHLPKGFVVTGHELTLQGLCDVCGAAGED